jgi:hypothetical protein
MAHRKRPKRPLLDASRHPRLRAKWRRWLSAMRSDVMHLYQRQEIFWQLQDVAQHNEKVLKPGVFFEWMCQNYVVYMAMGIRSFDDMDSRSHSLGRMLYELLEHPGAISREFYCRIYSSTPMGTEYGIASFNELVGKRASALGPRAIRADLSRLEAACERVRRFVNKRIAHRATPGAIRRLPRFNELDAALRVIESLVLRYSLLLTGNGTASLQATSQYDWRHVLYDPWIPSGSPLHPNT